MKELRKTNSRLLAGAAISNITPHEHRFLFGYPFVERISEGVNDPLLSSALYLADGENQLVLIANDVIFLSKVSVARIRKGISQRTGIPASDILVSATHTHSGPVTVNYVSSSNDPAVPEADTKYLRNLESQIIEAGYKAFNNASPAEAGFLLADGTGIGTNRHDPSGPSDTDIPAMVLRKQGGKPIACMLICSMHPTVMREDSKLISGDFPAFAREILQKKYLGSECPVLHFTGPAGNQSPRHVTKDNSFGEARRIGGIIADAIISEINEGMEYSSDIPLNSCQKFIDLPRRRFPVPDRAAKQRDRILRRLDHLKKTSENKKEIRTAEVDWFGAEELLHLSKLAASNELEKVYQTCLPAEIQILRIGSWRFTAWPGEIFVEYGIELKKAFGNVFLITLANGELQGYIVTKDAERNGYYEASNSIFHHSAGKLLLEETIELLKTRI